MSSLKKLSQLENSKSASIVSVNCNEAMRSRLSSLGFYPGAAVTAIFNSISGEPRAYHIQGSIIALRSCDAEKIIIK